MRIDKITFKAGRGVGGESLVVDPKRVTVFIGPNNGGKSKALSELQQSVAPAGYQEPVIFSSVSVTPIEEPEFEAKLSRLVRPKRAGEDASPDVFPLEGRGGRQLTNVKVVLGGLRPDAPRNQREYAAQHFLRHFYINLSGTDRLQLANPAQAEPIGGNPTSTISSLFQKDDIRKILSDVVYKAFNQYLIIDPTQMPNLTYRLSNVSAAESLEKRLDAEAAEFFSNAMKLESASDGTKAFVGILAEVFAGDPDIVFVDEPEAFLHPSLSHLLGQQIASNAREGKQVFAATHSSSFLLGCILSGADVDIIRLTYRNGGATARYLSADRLASLMTDPLFRSVGAAAALFYESAIIVEGDSDRAFYDEINDRSIRYSNIGVRHATFLNAHNKQTVVNIVAPLRETGIPAAFILDLDWVKEDGQVWDRYFTALGAPPGLKESMSAARRHIRSALEAADPNFKRKGGVALLEEAERSAADAFFDQMEEYGLFTVRAGELESWLPNLAVERTKSKWLPAIFQAMGSDPESASYLRPGTNDVWQFVTRIRDWTTNPRRRGMG